MQKDDDNDVSVVKNSFMFSKRVLFVIKNTVKLYYIHTYI